MQDRKNVGEVEELDDRTFSSLTIQGYVARLLNIPEVEVPNKLFNALRQARKTAQNWLLLQQAMQYPLEVGGAMLLIVKTDQGLQLLHTINYVNKKVVGRSYGSQKDESIRETVLRGFREEYGNPRACGIIGSIINKAKNAHSVTISNRIGRSAAEIAARILDVKADATQLLINVSVLYANVLPVSYEALKKEVAELNKRLQVAQSFYLRAYRYRFKHEGVDFETHLANAEFRQQICCFINEFIDTCKMIIPPNQAERFGAYYGTVRTTENIMEALNAILDLTENKSIHLMPVPELLRFLVGQPEFPDEYDEASFRNLKRLKGEQSPNGFLVSLENRIPSVKAITLGILQPRSLPTVDSAPAVVVAPGMSQ